MRLRAIAEIQRGYKTLMRNSMTKKQLCELIIPFRDHWKLSDKQALALARGEMSLQVADELMTHNDECYLMSVLETLNSVAPMPWRVRGDDLSSYVVDSNNNVIFGGENSEGRVDYTDPWMEPLIEMTKIFAGMGENIK